MGLPRFCCATLIVKIEDDSDVESFDHFPRELFLGVLVTDTVVGCTFTQRTGLLVISLGGFSVPIGNCRRICPWGQAEQLVLSWDVDDAILIVADGFK
ncbi:hypothetical protein Tco_0422648 [Tanacetum coccineum]